MPKSGVIPRGLQLHTGKSRLYSWTARLFLNKLDTMAAVEHLVVFYAKQHNSVVPHSARGGLIPDEVYFGNGAGVREKLTAAWQRAREARLASNRAVQCGACAPEREASRDAESSVIPRVLQMLPPDSRMFA